MSSVLFDTSIYISALRGIQTSLVHLQGSQSSDRVWLSAVVLEELYAGVRPKDRPVIEHLERDFNQARRILVPNLVDWTQTGTVLSLLAAGYGYEQIDRGRLTNDALIAVSAGRMGIKIYTANARDFARLAEFHSFTWSIL